MITVPSIVVIISMYVLGYDGKTASDIGGAFILPFPINLWVLYQKNRSWAWALLALAPLCWIPLALKNKSGEENASPEKYIKIAKGIRIVKEGKATKPETVQSQTSESGHFGDYNKTPTHSDK
jgi:hypothetical protein